MWQTIKDGFNGWIDKISGAAAIRREFDARFEELRASNPGRG